MSLGLAFRAFFAVLSRRDSAERVRTALAEPAPTPKDALPAPAPAPPKALAAPPTRSDALTLLSALQREARLLDLIMEPLDGVEDAAIGAAVREVLRDSHKTLDRMFAIQPLADKDEGESLDLPASPSPALYRLVGKSAPAARGTITHRGWKATKCEVPKWTGTSNESQVIAPTEIEVV